MSAAMFMPRGYSLTSAAKARSPSPRSRKSAQQPRSKMPEAEVRCEKEVDIRLQTERREKDITGKPKRISSISHSTPSCPVVIPTRTPTSKGQRASNDDGRRPSHDQHDPNALSPSMAALLAVTETRASARAIKGDHRRRLMRDTFRTPVSSTSPKSWSILQSPPSPTAIDAEQDKETDGEFDVGSMTSQSTLADRLAMYRSLSSDSIPSLDIESDVQISPDSPPMPRTPSSRRGRSPRREKHKLLSTSEPLAAGELHPLSKQHSAESNQPLDGIGEEADSSAEESSNVELVVTKTRKSSKVAAHFKSNLTASLQKLKSAARSISIPAPSVSSVLAVNSKFVSDKRPDPPRPKSPLPLTNSAFSPKTLSMLDLQEPSDVTVAQRMFFSSTPGEEYRPISSSIQLQEYTRRVPDRNPLLDRATAPPIFASSASPPPILLPGIDSPRPREPRENSSFLRVVVLEMNMRRAGKLGDVAGRARIWIGPRLDKAKSSGAAEPVQHKTGPTTRAEKGMGEEVRTELAEAMAIEENSHASDAAIQKGTEVGSTRPGSLKAPAPTRWVAWVPTEEA